MLSTAHHHYPPMFSPLPSDMRPYPTGHANPQRIQTSGLDSLTSGSQYALQHLQSMSVPSHSVGPAIKGPNRVRHHPYESAHNKARLGGRNGEGRPDEKNTSGPVRRRISRACDQCNQLRTKCDGMSPCAHCVEFSLACEYFRERKKRGKASRKDIAQQQAAAAAAAAGSNGSSGTDPGSPDSLKGTQSGSDLPPPPRPSMPNRTMSGSETSGTPQGHQSSDLVRANSMSMIPDQVQLGQQMNGLVNEHNRNHMADSPTAMSVGSYGMMQDYNRQNMAMVSMHGGQVGMSAPMQLSQSIGTPNSYATYNDGSFPLMSPHDQGPNAFPFSRPGESPLNAFMAGSPVAGSPGWLSLPSPSSGSYPSQLLSTQNTLRYPVLQPLIPKLRSILPISLACDLLDLYFTSSSSAHMHPLSPYLLGFVFRKRSFLHPTRPRACSPALLASMLWVAAQTSDASFLTSPPAARGRICQKLLELTVSLLRPLIHGAGSPDATPNFGVNTVINGVALGGLGVETVNPDRIPSDGAATATLDDVATYFHLATVISASEYKAASLRWWNAAWSLARELKLGRELPPNPPNSGARDQVQGDDADADGEVDLEMDEQGVVNGVAPNSSMGSPPPGTYSEEEREERRRIWWLLYTVDRHLALCYNRPLFLLDAECADLLQPINESIWQAGEFYAGNSSLFPDPSGSQPPRHRGPTFECTSHSIFGYFTPLMTILGEIVEINQARNHPRFGTAFRSASEWDDQAQEITHQLEAYGRSLKEFEARYSDSADQHRPEVGTPSVRSVNSSSSRMTESIIQTKTVVAYGTHVMHVLHILLTGKWDPISLLDDSDLWISSQSFIFATQHAVSAAEAVSDILEYDPDLSFMPFFFGIYLLQGSFLLLLIADKLQGEASQSVVGACEVVVRAVEACVVTLNTEYQRNFRKVMRSALAQVKGRIPEDFGEQQQRRREVLSLYRWTGDGSGLAL